MIASKDQEEIFDLLERSGKNNFTYKSDLAVSFDHENCFCLVIFISSSGEKGLQMYKIENADESPGELLQLQALLSERSELTSRQNVYLEAIRLVQQRTDAIPPKQLFYDAH